jgi:hypothetical protein
LVAIIPLFDAIECTGRRISGLAPALSDQVRWRADSERFQLCEGAKTLLPQGEENRLANARLPLLI